MGLNLIIGGNLLWAFGPELLEDKIPLSENGSIKNVNMFGTYKSYDGFGATVVKVPEQMFHFPKTRRIAFKGHHLDEKTTKPEVKIDTCKMPKNICNKHMNI